MNAAHDERAPARPPSAGRHPRVVALVTGSAAAVAAVHLALLVLVRLGWLTLAGFTAAAAILSGVAIGAMVHLAGRAASGAGPTQD